MHLAALRKFWEAQSIWPGFPLGGVGAHGSGGGRRDESRQQRDLISPVAKILTPIVNGQGPAVWI